MIDQAETKLNNLMGNDKKVPADKASELSDLVSDMLDKTELDRTSGSQDDKKNRFNKMKKLMKAQADSIDQD